MKNIGKLFFIIWLLLYAGIFTSDYVAMDNTWSLELAEVSDEEEPDGEQEKLKDLEPDKYFSLDNSIIFGAYDGLNRTERKEKYYEASLLIPEPPPDKM